MVWDRGPYTPESSDHAAASLENGELKFVLHGKKLHGSWVLIHTRNNHWLLIKQRDAYASSEDVTRLKPRSVLSGRTLSEIATMGEARRTSNDPGEGEDIQTKQAHQRRQK
jgi:bifunctional non-homologous end joining protein LigD